MFVIVVAVVIVVVVVVVVVSVCVCLLPCLGGIQALMHDCSVAIHAATQLASPLQGT